MTDLLLESIVSNLLTVFPLINKKIIHPINLLDQTDLAPSHFHILLVLEENNMMATSELGKRLSILKSNITPLINTLIKYEYVERIPSTVDRRYIYIKLTSKGKAFLQEKKMRIHNELKKNLAILDHDDLVRLEASLQVVHEMIFKVITNKEST